MRLIDADALIEKHREVCSYSMKFNLDLAPTVDAVPVVRCKDCKHMMEGYDYNLCKVWADIRYCKNDSFCSYGERIDGSVDDAAD